MARLNAKGQKIASAIHTALAEAFQEMGDAEMATRHRAEATKFTQAPKAKKSTAPTFRVLVGGVR